MGFVWTVVVGFCAGLVAKYIMPGKYGGGFVITTLLGIAGAIVATYLGKLIGWYEPGEGAGFVGAVAGAALLLYVHRQLSKT